jgi:hypothetical protein
MEWKKINRVEVVNHYADEESPGHGRSFVFWVDEGTAEVAEAIQDEGRTLKIFIRRTAGR